MPLQENLLSPRPAWFGLVLPAIGRHEFLTARQCGAVASAAPAEVEPVLRELVAEGLLQALMPTHAPQGGDVSPAYVLTRQGLGLLRSLGRGDRAHLVRVDKSRFTLAHDLLRNEFALTLEGLSKMGRLTLHRFETAREKIAAVGHVSDGGLARRVPLVADGLAVMSAAGETTALLVEIDRGTIAVDKMGLRYRGYLAWFRDQGPLRRFGLRSLRVLTVAPNESRLKRLRGAALDATDGRGSGLFWFCGEAALDCLDPERLTGQIATVARPGEVRLERLFA